MLRKVAASLLSAALLASFSLPAALAAPGLTVDRSASRVTMRFQRPGTKAPQLLAGVLSAPSTAAPVAIARAYLATRPEILAGRDAAQLRPVARKLLQGNLVRHFQSVNGVEVIGGDVLVRIDERGQVRWAAGSPVAIPAGFSTVPKLDVEAALASVVGNPRLRVKGNVDRRKVRLVVDGLRGARLAYVIDLPGQFAPLEQLRVRIDADSGEVLAVQNMIHRGGPSYSGNVFLGNPISTPTLTSVPLGPWMDTTQAAPLFLTGPGVDVYNCLDKQQCTDIMGFSLHVCTNSRGAMAATNGDFLDIGRPADDTNGDDQFAEVQMFYHVNKIYDYFRGLGFDELVEKPLTAVVNLRLPIDLNDLSTLPAALCTGGVPSPGHKFYPFDNAAYASDASLFGVEGGAIVFGQASFGDMAYDGDVVYHEFTHALMHTLTPDFGANTLDEYGEDPTTGGMTEGMADYFSSAYLNDPDLGEYAFPALGFGDGPMRTLTNTKTCPTDMANETHEDGEPWAAALWDARAALPEADRSKYDQAVYNVMAALSVDDDQITASIKIAAEVEVLIGASQADAALVAYQARGLEDECGGRVIDMTAGGLESKKVLFVSTPDQSGLTPSPGAMQFKIDLPPEGAKSITIETKHSSFAADMAGPTVDSKVELIVKPGSEPIRWTYSGSAATSDATSATASLSCTDGEIYMDVQLRPCTATVAGPFPGGTAVVTLQSVGGGGNFQGITFRAEPDDGLGGADAGAGIDAGSGGGDVGEDDDDDGGCGCRAGGSSSSTQAATALMIGLAFLPLVRRRRRK